MTGTRRSGGEGGAVMAEVALVFALIFGLIASLIDISGNFYAAYYTAHAVREGGRAAAVAPSLDTEACGTISLRIKDNIEAHTGLEEVSVTVNPPAPDAGLHDIVSVTASGRYHFAFLGLFGVRSAPVKRTHTIHFEAAGTPGPIT